MLQGALPHQAPTLSIGVCSGLSVNVNKVTGTAVELDTTRALIGAITANRFEMSTP
jgi:hypothetical protein